MNRKEEIVTQAVKEQSQLHQPLEWGAGFISGAKWADKTMLDRACEWLYINAENYTVNGGLAIETLIYCFKKAMEGGAE